MFKNIRLLSALGLLLVAGQAHGQGDEDLPAADKPANMQLKSVQEKASYGFGYQIGRSFRGQGMKLSLEALVSGLRDGLAAKKPAVAEQELFPAMQEHQRASMTELANSNKKAGEEFLKANKDKPGIKTLESGLQYEVLKEGTGPTPAATDRVQTHYHGTLIDGTVFDSSVEQGQPVTFGVNEVIPGWTEALQRMKVGGKWRLFIPSELAYGVQGAAPDIGPNSTLIFEIELLGIEQ